ncbi:MAG: hypothetical protein IJO63_03920 [Bacilli bacterium]|nr:hypothetical protein [Bacilli bacterium]
MKKILITYVSYGSGHKTIAEYIANHIKCRNYEIKLVDLTDTMNKRTLKTVDVFDYIYKHRLEKFFSFLYKVSDNKFISKNYKIYTKKFLYNEKVRDLYCDFNPDIVLSTHWYGSNLAAYMKEKGLINPKIVTVITDYKMHKIWLTSYDKDEHFIVANDIVKRSLEEAKCYSKNIYAYGLPVDVSKAAEIIPKAEIYKKYDLEPDKKRLLFFGGGSAGNMAYYKYLKKLLALPMDYEVLFVCGNHKELYNSVKALEKKHKNLKTFGFVTNVYELMDISEIVISKTGAATITECLEMRKFLVGLPGMGGQENYNAKFVKKNNYGTMVKGKWTFIWFMKKYLANPDKYLNKYNAKKVNSQALKQIAGLIKKL